MYSETFLTPRGSGFLGDPNLDRSQLPHENMAPQLNFTIWLLTAVSAGFLCLRLYCKYLRHRGLWIDDHFLIAAWVALMLNSVALSVSTTFGFGKHTYDIPKGGFFAKILLSGGIAGSFAILAATLSKTSFAFTLLRISTERWMKWLIWFIIISMNAALGLAILFTWIQCDPVEKTFRPSVKGNCWPKSFIMHYNIFTASYSGAMDIILAILPWKIIWGLTMNKKEKFGVLFAMSMGVFAGIVSFIKIMTLSALVVLDLIHTVELNIWGTAESAVTIIAASIPILRALFRDLRPPGPPPGLSDEEAASWHRGFPQSGNIAVATIGSAPSQKELEIEYELEEFSRNPVSPRLPLEKTGFGTGLGLGSELTTPGRILQTSEVRVEYQPRGR